MGAAEHLGTYAEGWTTGDADTILKAVSDDYTFDDPSVGKIAKNEFASFPDAHWGNARHFVYGNRGVSEWIVTGTRTDGSRVEVSGCDLSMFRDGKIAIKNSYRKNRPPVTVPRGLQM